MDNPKTRKKRKSPKKGTRRSPRFKNLQVQKNLQEKVINNLFV